MLHIIMSKTPESPLPPQQTGHITFTAAGQYKIGDASFIDLISAIEFASRHNIQLQPNEYTVAYGLGAVIATFSNAEMDLAIILRELEEGTDREWWVAAKILARALLEKTKEMNL